MPRQDVESRIWYEDAILDNALALPSRYKEEEEEEEKYLFWPSSPESHVVLSERLSQDGLVEASSPTLYQPSEGSEHDAFAYPTIYRPSIDSEDGMTASSIIPPPSPTYSFISDYVFPEREPETGMDAAGYSRVFTAGLALKSRQITRQLGSFYRDLRRVFNWSSWLGRAT